MTIELAESAILKLGDAVAGGTFVARIRINDVILGLVVAPKAEGERQGAWHAKRKAIAGAESFFDGEANTRAMAEAGSELASWALGLQIGGTEPGWSAWHLPARDELELLYRYLKPTDDDNTLFSGDNPSAVPPTWPYRDETKQTELAAFRKGGAEAMQDWWYWSSTQYSESGAWGQGFSGGGQDGSGKKAEGWARAVRLIHLTA